MDYYFIFTTSIVSVLVTYYSLKVLKWILQYLYMVWVIKKIPGLPITPFIGNSNKFIKKDSGILKEI